VIRGLATQTDFCFPWRNHGMPLRVLKDVNLGPVEVRMIDGKLVADQELDERR
jgi:hypothetical protein